jgi:hypothetical protein
MILDLDVGALVSRWLSNRSTGICWMLRRLNLQIGRVMNLSTDEVSLVASEANVPTFQASSFNGRINQQCILRTYVHDIDLAC